MHRCLAYIYILIFIIIQCVESSDKYPYHPEDNGNDEGSDFNLIIKGIENLLDEDDDQTAGQTVISDNIMQHGLGSITDQTYGTAQPSQLIPQSSQVQSGYYQQHLQPVPIPPQHIPEQIYPLTQQIHYEYHPQRPIYRPPYLQTQPRPQPIQQAPQYGPIYHYQPPEIRQPRQPYPRPAGPSYYSRRETPGNKYFGQRYHPYEQSHSDSGHTPHTNTGSGLLHPDPYRLPHPSQIIQQTQPPQASKEPLQPERVTVEVGSDEDDEETEEIGQEPSEPEQPEEAEEGAVGGAGDGDDEEEEEEKPSEAVKKCKKIRFFKKNSEGNIIPMIKKDFKRIHDDDKLKKYLLYANLEVLLCDGDVVYKHNAGINYPTQLSYNKVKNIFIFTRRGGFLLIKYSEGEWRVEGRRDQEYLKFYSKTHWGKYVEITCNDYYTELSAAKAFKYTFREGVNCEKVTYKGETIWRRKKFKASPESVRFTPKGNVIIYFSSYLIVFGKRQGSFKQILARPR
ncbi:SVSP family protein [Theileria parva strain Muguga]|uniref:Theileria-specific sub-telomeric protein, SVSP family n=1 Tax=Theileria parva TaxID=5875 RepID=Q4N3G8_THEPA|nr:SVSP family protein [Theileria parva strain Muguga]EAN31367.1 SVSP family protein [Theileria parva strain Muguga]|eukprot:XP_763650.1 hypothetical protein [Theileria parva strain Muguga]